MTSPVDPALPAKLLLLDDVRLCHDGEGPSFAAWFSFVHVESIADARSWWRDGIAQFAGALLDVMPDGDGFDFLRAGDRFRRCPC